MFRIEKWVKVTFTTNYRATFCYTLHIFLIISCIIQSPNYQGIIQGDSSDRLLTAKTKVNSNEQQTQQTKGQNPVFPIQIIFFPGKKILDHAQTV